MMRWQGKVFTYPCIFASVVIITLLSLVYVPSGYCADKLWTGTGDGSSWVDGDNWFSSGVPTSGVPTSADDVAISAEGASVSCAVTFAAKSITLGGGGGGTLTVDNFVFGTVTPDSTEDVAVLARKDGTLSLQGNAGTLTLKGQYKSTDEEPSTEKSFMFWVE